MAKKDRARSSRPATEIRLTKRQLSSARREQRKRLVLYIVMGVTAVVVAGLIVGGILRDQVFLPRETVLTVNGSEINRETYWKFRRYQLGQELQQLQFQAQFGGQNAQFNQQRAQALQKDLRDYRTAPLDVPTLETLATNTMLTQRAAALGITVDEAAIDDEVRTMFAPPPATPTPVTTAEASQTAAAKTAIATLTPVPTTPAPPVLVSGTPAISPTMPPTTGPSPTPTPYYTPTTTPSPTPMDAAAQSTALATFREQSGMLRQLYGMSAEDYRQLVVLPDLLEKKIKAKLAESIPDTQPQVHAAHILVPSLDVAREIKTQLDAGSDFAIVAKVRSSDSSNKDKGGDLDWFSRGVMAKEFEEAAFSQPVGVVGEPVQTQFGWHLIKVLERSDKRPVTANTLEQLRQSAYDKWLKEQRGTTTIVAGVTLPNFAAQPTPTPVLVATPAAATPPSASPGPSGTPSAVP